MLARSFKNKKCLLFCECPNIYPRGVYIHQKPLKEAIKIFESLHWSYRPYAIFEILDFDKVIMIDCRPAASPKKKSKLDIYNNFVHVDDLDPTFYKELIHTVINS